MMSLKRSLEYTKAGPVRQSQTILTLLRTAFSVSLSRDCPAPNTNAR